MFDVSALNAQLREMGQSVAWRHADACPCRNVRDGTGSPDQDCPTCCGKGVIWATAVSAWTGIAGQRVAREWQRFGAYESGDEVLSIPSDSPLYAIGENDRVVMSQSSEPFSIVLERTGRERVDFPVVSISRVFWLDPATRAIVEGPIPTVNADGTITWPTPDLPVEPVTTDTGQTIVTNTGQNVEVTVPPANIGGAGSWLVTDTGQVIDFSGTETEVLPPMVGSDRALWEGYSDGLRYLGPAPYPVQIEEGRPSSGQYTITGRKNPEYFCFKELPQDRAHFMGQSLPRRVVLRRFSLFGAPGP